jgi:quinol monooxygenase YgiN
MPEFIVRYRVKPELVEEQEAAIKAFVDGVRSVGDPDVFYASFKGEDGVSFTHVGRFRTQEALENFQAQPHFRTFSEGLKPRCVEGPNATKVELVAMSLD